MAENHQVTRIGAEKLLTVAALVAAAVFALSATCAASGTKTTATGRETTMKSVEELLENFRKGKKFRKDVRAFVSEGEPNREAVKALAAAMRSEAPQTGEKVAKVLAEIARQTDELRDAGGNLVRDRQIVEIFVREGLSKQDAVRDFCLKVLLWNVPADMLASYGAELTQNLSKYPDSAAFLVIAKAKPPEARKVVEGSMASAGAKATEEMKIAAAALGDAEWEKKFINAFVRENDPVEKGRLARVLGFIGTKTALTALASEMRTDLIDEMPMVSLRSVRLDIVAALSFAFPDKPFLYDNAIMDDSGYERVEKFCETTFGVRWKKERPPFLTIQGLPAE